MKKISVILMLLALLLVPIINVFATPTKKTIDVVFDDNLKIYVDGSLAQLKDSSGNSVQPFIYNGMVYAPVASLIKFFDTPIVWDSKASSLYIGKILNDKGQFLSSLDYARASNTPNLYFDNWHPSSFSIAGKEYSKGLAYHLAMEMSNRPKDVYIVYNLNSLYSQITGLFGTDDREKNSPNNWTQMIILGDDEEIYKSPEMVPGNPPTLVEVDLKGINQIVIRFIITNGCNPVFANPLLFTN